VVEHTPKGLAWAQRKKCQIDAIGPHPSVDQRLGAIITATGQRQLELVHSKRTDRLPSAPRQRAIPAARVVPAASDSELMTNRASDVLSTSILFRAGNVASVLQDKYGVRD
jgi:hypothetical protein